MIIYNPNTVPIIDIEVDDSSYRYMKIMESDSVILEFSLTEHVELPVGAYITFENTRYELLKDENVKISHSRHYEYSVTFSGPLEMARNYIIHNIVDHRLKFDLTASPADHLAMIVANMNERGGGVTWVVGSCIEKSEITISYNHTYCVDGLSQLADECKTEFEVVRRSATTFAVNLGKVEYYKSDPLELGYGKGQGFDSGVQRTDSSAALEKIWIEGSDRNISLKEYGASTLHLPQNESFGFDGEKFEGEAGYDSGKAVSMVTDAEGFSVALASAGANTTEGSLNVEHIYPKRVGDVSAVRFEYRNWYYTYEELIEAFPDLTDEDWDSVQVDIVDASIPAGLDYSECLMTNDSPLVVTFQTGPLAGREFDATFRKESKTETRQVEVEGEIETQTVTRPANRFELVKADHDGVNMPTRNFLPAAANQYIVTNCIMPAAYISDPDTFSGAEWEALREAARYLYENKDRKRSYKGTIDGLFAKRDWTNIADHLRLGAYVSFFHPQVQETPIAVRIVAIKQYINKPNKPEIEISDDIVSVSKSTSINEIKNRDAHIDALAASTRRFAKRGFRDAKETAEMLVAAAFENFDPAISPIAIQTMQLLAGDESLQFKFWTDRSCTTAVSNPVTYDPETKQLSVSVCALQHMTLGIKTLKPGHDTSEYLRWSMGAYTSAILSDPIKKYYLYAKVNANNDGTDHLDGSFLLSETAIGMRSVSGFYHLLVGMLMAERDNDRSFAPMFGFTEILPGQVTTDRISSSNGLSFLDMVANAFRMGGGAGSPALEWNIDGDGKIRLVNGCIVQSLSGDTFPVPCNRGAWISGTSRAFYGDLFSFQGQSWLCTDDTAIDEAHAITTDPAQDSHWTIYAEKGSSAATAFKSIVFKRTNSTPATPAGGSFSNPVPDGWSDGVPSGEAKLWMSTRVFTSDGQAPQENVWTTPQPATDTADIDFEYSEAEINPGTPTTSPDTWHNTATSDDIWMAIRKKQNGEWGAWDVMKIKGENGLDGQDGQDGRDGQDGVNGVSTFKSIVFKRSNSTPSSPTGGSYDSPVPSGWSDGVPSGDQQLWMSTRVFTNEAVQTSSWTTPRPVSDTADIDFEFSSVENNPGTPTSNPSNWSNNPDENTIWMAVRKCKNGVWGSWEITKIKGEDGADGTSPYHLELTNENMSVNADSSGNIIPGGYRPSCTARLYIGSYQQTDGVTFSLHNAPSGVTIGSSTGVITLASNLSFSGDAVEIEVRASMGGSVVCYAILNISKCKAGTDGTNGTNGADGVDGKDGTSIEWQGNFAAHPSNPQNGWAYYNTTTKKSYTYRNGTWYQMTVDGVDGANGRDGNDGLSITWKGDSATPPSNPQKNWCYRDTDNGCVYIYNGTAWELMTHDGSDGEDGTDGADGSDGLSVFITYHGNPADTQPSTPTGSGTTGGWHTNPLATDNWMSQKVAASASEGSWGTPIQICGADAVSYEIGVNADAVSSDKHNGSYINIIPATLTATAYKIVGGASPVTPPSADNIVIKRCYIKRSDGTRTSLTNDSSVSVTSTLISNYSHVVFGLYKDGVLWGGEEEAIPLLFNGEDGADGQPGADGESVVFADIDNEMEGVALNSSGRTVAAVTLKTTVSMWLGDTQKTLTGITVSGLPSGITESHSLSTGVITFTIASNTSVAANVPITITLNSSVGTRRLTFTIAGVKAGTDGADGTDGSDGSDAVIYSLLPSVTSVKKDKHGQYSVASVTCQRKKRVGQGGYDNTSDGTLKMSLDGGAEQNYASVSTGAFSSAVTFLFYVNNVLVDRETVPMLIDGTDGRDGQDGQDGRDGETGPTVRGPVEYVSGRWYYSGKGDVSGDDESKRWVDLVLVRGTDGSYAIYQCTASHYANTSSPASGKWESSNFFNLIATAVVYAEDAVIERAIIRKLKTDIPGFDRIEAVGDTLKAIDSNNVERMVATGGSIDLTQPASFASYTSIGVIVQTAHTYTGSGTHGGNYSESATLISALSARDGMVVRIPDIKVTCQLSNPSGSPNATISQIVLSIKKGSTTLWSASSGGGQNIPGGQSKGITVSGTGSSGYLLRSGEGGSLSVAITVSWAEQVTGAVSNLIFSATVSDFGAAAIDGSVLQKILMGRNGLRVTNGGGFASSFGVDSYGSPIIIFQGVNTNGEVVGIKIDSAGVAFSQGNRWQLLTSQGGVTPGGSVVGWNQIVTTGTKIAEITINGTKYDVFAPSGSVGSYLPLSGGTMTGDIAMGAHHVFFGTYGDIYGSGNDLHLNAKSGSGQIITNRYFYDASDERLKDIIKGIDFSIDDLRSIPKVLFAWKDDETKREQIGTIAQGLKDKFPQLVTRDEKGIYAVNYDALGVLALHGIDLLAEENRRLEERLRKIEDKLGL